jgi:adenine-specific DNA-methyltransferase
METMKIPHQTQHQTPKPNENERPTAYADRLGQWYAASVSQRHKKSLGQYLTHVEIAMFMARLCNQVNHSPLQSQFRVLDPGAGSGILSCALCEALAERRTKPEGPEEQEGQGVPLTSEGIDLEAWEMDPELAVHLNACLSYAKKRLQASGITLTFTINTDDFVMAHAELLDNSLRLFPGRLGEREGREGFDLVIANPPYFKVAKSDPRAQAAAAIVHGQPNIYAFFMAICASLLKAGGRLIFITPRSYAAGPYFHLFRNRFFATMQPEAIHLFGSRQDAFSRDDILQENIILVARRSDKWWQARGGKEEMVEVSSSAGISDLSTPVKRRVSVSEILDMASKDKILRIPVAERDDHTDRLVRSWPGNLHTYGFEISTGPVVPFRATTLLSREGDVPMTHAPLLWMQNVTAMRVEWPIKARGKEQYIAINNAASKPLLVADKNYVLLRRFSAKEQQRRLIAAPLLAGTMGSPFIGLENHLNYIHRPGGSLTQEEAYGLAVLLNSALLDTFFRTYNGNTQVSATELRAMPLPPLDIITELGRRAMTMSLSNLTDLSASMVIAF